MKFRYKGLDAEEQPIRGELEAASHSEALAQLEGQEIEVTSLLYQPDRMPSLSRPGSAEMALFCDQLAGLIDTGMPLPEGLRSLAQDAFRPSVREALQDIATQMERGVAMDKAMEAHSHILGPLLPKMIQAGQRTGNLSGPLRMAAQHNWQLHDIRNNLIAAAAYPVIVLLALGGLFLYCGVDIIPPFREMFEEMKIPLPGPTQMLFRFHEAVYTVLPMTLLLTAGLAAIALLVLQRALRCASAWQWILFRLPILGRALKGMFLNRFCALMAQLLEAGLSTKEAFSLATGLGGAHIPEATHNRMLDMLDRGESLEDVMRMQTAIFPEFLIWVTHTGIQSGRLPETLRETADLFARNARRQTVVFTTLLAPALTLVVGATVFFVVYALFAPLISIVEGIA